MNEEEAKILALLMMASIIALFIICCYKCCCRISMRHGVVYQQAVTTLNVPPEGYQPLPQPYGLQQQQSPNVTFPSQQGLPFTTQEQLAVNPYYTDAVPSYIQATAPIQA